MPKVESAIFSYEDMKRRWNQDNPDNPYSRRDELQQGIYELDKWLIRVDDEGKTIATIGWKEYPSHTVVGGLLAANRANPRRPEFEEGLGRNERALQSAREPQMNQSKPLVAAFGAREGSPEAWIERGRSRGWVFSQDENFNQVRELLPEQVINEWNSAYPNGNWAIRPITDADSLAKWVFIDDPYPDWFNMLKRVNLHTLKPMKSLGQRYKEHLHDYRQLYKRHLEWLVNTPMTNSKQKALAAFYHQLITNHEKRLADSLRRKVLNHSNVDIKKFYPTNNFDATGVKDERGEHQTFPAKGLVVGNAIVMFTSHYLDGHNRKASKTIPITSQVYNTLLAAKGRNMWAYVNDDPNDYSYVLVEYITGNDRINRAPRGQPRSTPNAFRGMGIDAMLNFYHYTEGGGLPNFRRGTPETNIVPIFYKNEETNNIKPGHRNKR